MFKKTTCILTREGQPGMPELTGMALMKMVKTIVFDHFQNEKILPIIYQIKNKNQDQ